MIRKGFARANPFFRIEHSKLQNCILGCFQLNPSIDFGRYPTKGVYSYIQRATPDKGEGNQQKESKICAFVNILLWWEEFFDKFLS